MKSTLFMETTQVPAERTAGEITAELVRSGATSVHSRYKDGRVVGISWSMVFNGAELWFDMPARIEPVYKLLRKRALKTRYALNDKEDAALRAKAERVGWRQLLRWVQVQVAMVECGMAEAREVFLPYWQQQQGGKTLFAFLEERQFRALPAPGQSENPN
jgi:hypothetical protein